MQDIEDATDYKRNLPKKLAAEATPHDHMINNVGGFRII
jgi:hypothetical protein